METFLHDEVQMYQRYRTDGPSAASIAFKDLWMLFNRGDTICCRSRDTSVTKQTANREDDLCISRFAPQAYRVTATYGGTRLAGQKPLRVVDGTPRTSHGFWSRGNYAPLLIECYYLDYDGHSYGVVPDVFEINPYVGTVDIINLDAFPVDYLTEFCVASFRRRGAEYLNYRKAAHKYYQGFTADKAHEDINSPVVIDLPEAYQHNAAWRPVFSKVEMPNTAKKLGYFRCSREVTSCASTVSDQYLPDYFEDLYPIAQANPAWPEQILLMDLQENFYHQSTETMKSADSEELKRVMTKHHHLELLPGVVYGFALRERRWVSLDISRVHDIGEQKAFEDLVLPPGHRDLVLALVQSHDLGEDARAGSIGGGPETDIVKGKGKGTIILLHGEPGVGKTSTAECVAAYTGRPLYPITCGDLGSTAGDVEMNLRGSFNLAHKWGAVLLLDEADVFLSKRSPVDLQRNAVVSVFLRILEYYAGILFLTTNRVGAFDPAFRSRIHLSLFYPGLDFERTMAIWEKHVARFIQEKDNAEGGGFSSFDIDKNGIKDFVGRTCGELRWNGRQIKNAWQTALALAKYEASKKAKETGSLQRVILSAGMFEKVAQASRQFDDYLQQTHKADEALLAEREKVRYDHYAPNRGRGFEHSESGWMADRPSSSSESAFFGTPTPEHRPPFDYSQWRPAQGAAMASMGVPPQQSRQQFPSPFQQPPYGRGGPLGSPDGPQQSGLWGSGGSYGFQGP
ncbi:P-loop containing nucleoside triphosphate hydrolase protein [Xylariomycetidae sp. FL0641]|nr:P-loop containing nucleoside triphosphate hydrolase protein [Xylariomycetidae sp. FL0641]